MADRERRSFVERGFRWDSWNKFNGLLLVCYFDSLVHLNDNTGSAVNICVHEYVVLRHEALHQYFVLLGVATADYQISVRRDEPVEFFKPRWG